MFGHKVPTLFAVAGVLLAALTAPSTATAEPSAGRIVFTSTRDGNSEVYSMNVDGSDQQRLTNTSQNDRDPRWSPDGSRILYWTNNSEADIWVMDADGSNQTRLTTHPRSELEAEWSPDGSRIVYQGNPDNHNLDILVMNADGTGTVNLTPTAYPDTSEHSPAWSPDGSKIVFVAFRYVSDQSVARRIEVMEADGTDRHAITDWGRPQKPSWSPDGSKIAFSDGNDIYSMSAEDGSDTRQLTTGNTGYDANPRWSPDGTQIIYHRIDPTQTGQSDLYVMAADGSAQTPLTTAAGMDESPDWVVPLTLPSFAVQPSSKAVADGGTSTFKATVAGHPVPTVCWAMSEDGGGSWSDFVGDCGSPSGAANASSTMNPETKTVTLTVSDVSSDWSGRKFRAVATNSSGSVESDVVSLTVDSSLAAPSVTQQPADVTGATGDTSTFSASASGVPAPTVRWQSFDGTYWTDLSDGSGISGSSTESLSLSAVKVGMSGRKYRAIFTNDSGEAATDPATLTVASGALSKGSPRITGSAIYGQTLTVAPGTWTAGTAFDYVWQRLSSGGTVSPISGATGTTYRLSASDVGSRIRVLVTGQHPEYSSATVATAATTTVAYPVLWIRSVSPVLGYFYPYLKDGNRDVQRVNFSLNRPARYRIEAINDAGSAVYSSASATGTSGAQTWNGRKNDGRLAPPGRYRFRLVASAGGQSASKVSQAFYLKPGPVTLSAIQLGYSYIQPVVQDGKLDYQKATFKFSTRATYRVQVVNQSGSVVYQSSAYKDTGRSWYWSGRTNTGAKVPNGYYRVRVVGSAGGQAVTKISKFFALKSGYYWVVASSATRGGDAGTPSTSGACYITRESGEPGYYDEYAYYDPYYEWDPYAYYDPWTDTYTGDWVGGWQGQWVEGTQGTAEIDCWGGTGVMSYYFQVPAGAGKFSFSTAGEWSDSDLCCTGSVSKSGERRSSTVYRVSVKVTGLRAWIVNSVSLKSYSKRYY